MKIKASDGKEYEVDAAAPGGSHEVRLEGKAIGSFVVEADAVRVTVTTQAAKKELLLDIAEKFVDQGGAPMGML